MLYVLEMVGKHNNPSNNEILDLANFSHIKDIELTPIEGKSIELLVGSNYEELLDITEVRLSQKSRIAAKLSKFGWLLVGHTGPREDGDIDAEEHEYTSEYSTIHCASTYLLKNADADMDNCINICNGNANSCELLHAEIRKYFYDEFITTIDDEDAAPSIEDLECEKIYHNSVQKLDGRYSLNLPLRNTEIKIPNNKIQAKSRHMLQKRMLQNNGETKHLFAETFQALIDTDKLELINECKDSNYARVFYIPHFMTKQAKKDRYMMDLQDLKGYH